MVNSRTMGFKNFKNDMGRPFRGNVAVKVVAYLVGILAVSSIVI
ncbi:hypothetical protein J2127_000242 [Methanococcus voltae]|nr:hypothetical protein [Methanococcus voltae]MBP2143101.1 hypothetical protein [Methanococcus voltae]